MLRCHSGVLVRPFCFKGTALWASEKQGYSVGAILEEIPHR